MKSAVSEEMRNSKKAVIRLIEAIEKDMEKDEHPKKPPMYDPVWGNLELDRIMEYTGSNNYKLAITGNTSNVDISQPSLSYSLSYNYQDNEDQEEKE